MIRITDLHKVFGKHTVLNKINLNINGSGIFAVLGPNGSGKTTLIKSILGMVVPTDGDASVLGVSVRHSESYRNKISYLPQIANFPENVKVKELIKMIKDLREKTNKEARLIDMFGLRCFLNEKLSNLSGGTKQKVNIVLAFMFDAPLIILDEPTTGLDPISLIRLKELIHSEKARKKTILITSHIMSFVEEIADEIVFLLEGQIYFRGSIPQLKKNTNQVDLEHAIATILTNHHA